MESAEPFVFGVDLDGVCADYTVGFRDFCAERLGRDIATMPLERSWDFREWGFDQGVWIRIVTHRLYVNWGHNAAAADTVQWLDQARIPYRDLCFVGKKRDVGADAYVDDGPHNIEALRAAGRAAIVFDQPYNTDLGGLRASNWQEVEELIYELMAQTHGVAEPSLPGFDPDPERLGRRTGIESLSTSDTDLE